MPHLVLILPYLLSHPEQESGVRGARGEAWRYALERGTLRRLLPAPGGGLPEAALLGLAPGAVGLEDGPLTVAALGADPPPRSVHFHVSLGSVDEEGRIALPGPVPEAPDLATLTEAATRLNSRRLTFLSGEATSHGLVWEEGSLDLGCTPFAEAVGAEPHARLPEGDGEALLRRFIDDSINLLSELEVNRVRREEGLPPLNLLWPWGPGFREPVPNLAIRRGRVWQVFGAGLRLRGLARLAGYGLGTGFAWGLRLDPSVLRGQAAAMAIAPGLAEAQRRERLDYLAWTLETLNENALRPLLERMETAPFRFDLLAPGGRLSPESPPERAAGTGLWLSFDSSSPQAQALPFDERVLDDARVPAVHVWEAMASVLS